MEDQAQSLIDATTNAFKAGKLSGGVSIPPPVNIRPSMLGPPPGVQGMLPGMGPPQGPPPFGLRSGPGKRLLTLYPKDDDM